MAPPSDPATLIFHSPCFDGIVSAVLTADFVETKLGWKDVDLRPVDYSLREEWLGLPLGPRTAVVDFLYHPQAALWADHHATTFLTPEAERQFHDHPAELAVYDRSAPSCSQLLWTWLGERGHRNTRYEELVSWANVTDAARYTTVQDALDGRAPALRINNSLAVGESAEYSVLLVRQLRTQSLDAVAESPEVRARHEVYTAHLARSLADVAGNIHLDGDVAIYEARVDDQAFPRYAAYHFYPHARYSVGLLRRKDSATVTAMRNPWREFASEHLGRLFEPFGGGGHQRVASVVLRGPRADQAEEVRNQIASSLSTDVPASRRVAAVREGRE